MTGIVNLSRQFCLWKKVPPPLGCGTASVRNAQAVAAVFIGPARCGLNPSDQAAKNRAVYLLLRVCPELKQTER